MNMEYKKIALKIKDLRVRKGFSQEQLSEESKLSLRTIQRIEKGETIPRGDTLMKLTIALGVSPDEIMEFSKTDDTGYLSLLNLSALSVVIEPLLAIIIPLIMWILKKDKINLVDDTGKKLLNFQITFILVLYVIVIIITGEAILLRVNFLHILYFFSINLFFETHESLMTLPIVLIFIYNISLIVISLRRNQKGLKSIYKPAIPFLK